MTEIEERNISKLRIWIKDSEKKLFTDAELALVVARYAPYELPEDEEAEPIQLHLGNRHMDLCRAECFEMIASDIQRWTSYSAGGLSETFDKANLFHEAEKLRMRWGYASAELG